MMTKMATDRIEWRLETYMTIVDPHRDIRGLLLIPDLISSAFFGDARKTHGKRAIMLAKRMHRMTHLNPAEDIRILYDAGLTNLILRM